MTSAFKSIILCAVLCLALTNRASADFHFNHNNLSNTDDQGDNHGNDHNGDHDDHGDHHDHGNHGGSGDDGDDSDDGHDGKGPGPHGHGVTPEPSSYVLFVFGAGLLSLSYIQRKRLSAS